MFEIKEFLIKSDPSRDAQSSGFTVDLFGSFGP